MPTKSSSSKSSKETTGVKGASATKPPLTEKPVASKKAVTKKATAKKTTKEAPVATATVTKEVAAKKVSAAAKATAKPRVTTVVATLDIGWGNALYIRGEGAGLTWDKGILMDNVEADRWEWKTVAPHTGLTFKLLVNDTLWSSGENLYVLCGGTSISAPTFEI